MRFGVRLRPSLLRGNGQPAGSTSANPAQVASRWQRGISSRPSSMCCVPGASGKPCRESLALPAPSITIFNAGCAMASSSGCGKQDLQHTTRWRALHGVGKASTAQWARLLWGVNAWVRTPRIGGKNGRKRSLLVDARGIPLSIVVSGANTHDVKLLEATLEAIVVKRPKPRKWKPQHLCADAGYKGKAAKQNMTAKNYRPHIKQRKDEAEDKRNKPGYKARRWVVERTHSWLNRFRKLLVSFEKKEQSYLALLSLAAAMICSRQTISIHG